MSQPSSIAEAVLTAIHQRRAIYPNQLSGETVPRETVEQLLEAAHWAPNHGRTEPWFFKVYAGEGRRRLGVAQAELYRRLTPSTEYQDGKFQKLLNRPLEASHVIVICLKRGDNPKIPEIEEIEAVACAVQNLWLAATALGVGGYWSSGGVTYQDAFREYLGLGEQDRCLGFFYLGVPGPQIPPGRRKATWEEKTEWIEK